MVSCLQAGELKTEELALDSQLDAAERQSQMDGDIERELRTKRERLNAERLKMEDELQELKLQAHKLRRAVYGDPEGAPVFSELNAKSIMVEGFRKRNEEVERRIAQIAEDRLDVEEEMRQLQQKHDRLSGNRMEREWELFGTG